MITLMLKAIPGAIFWMLTQVYRECVSAFISFRAISVGRYSTPSARFLGGWSRVICWEKLSLNPGVKIMDGAFIDAEGGVWIGTGTIISRNVTILSSQHRYDGVAPFSNDRELKDVIIGNRVWIGMNAIILPGSKIGDEAIIGAGAIVSGVVEDGAIYVSPKAQKIKTRKDKS